MGTSHRRPAVGHRCLDPRRLALDLRPARRLRSRDGQWRRHRLLGCRRVRSDRKAQPTRRHRRVLVQVRQGHAGRPTSKLRTSSKPTTEAARRGRSHPIDAYAIIHNETSTGVQTAGATPGSAGLVLVDATSAAGAVAVVQRRIRRLLLLSAEGVRRRRRAVAGHLLAGRRRSHRDRSLPRTAGFPRSSSLKIALDNSRKNQTNNTPAIATLYLVAARSDDDGLTAASSWAIGRSETISRRRCTTGPSRATSHHRS